MTASGKSTSTQSPRYDFSPIVHRPPVRFPKGERLAVIIYVNIEHAPFGSTAPAHAVYPGTMQFSPDILNHGWRDYGNRVGLWRIIKAMDRFGYRGTVNLQSDVCREYPLILKEGNDRNWEWGAQGDNNTSVTTLMSEAVERDFIRRNVDIIEQATGKRPKGWLSWALAESFATPDLLAEAGIEYVSNYTHDELPVPMRVKRGVLLTMPYTLEINDVPAIMVKGTSAEVFGRMIKDQFDVLYEEGRERPRVMSISVHPFISGHPFRMKHIEPALEYIASHADVWLTTGGEINDWFRAHYLQIGKGSSVLRTFFKFCVLVLLFGFGARVIHAADVAPVTDALAEITVTAEKQSTNLQKTAAEVTAIPADALIDAGITDLRQAQMVVPSVRFQAEGNNTQVFIRGVGANLDFPNVEPNVAFNFAGVYMPREATSAAFFDVAQLEVLPGSQGTLYGRSAIGGTINLTPTKPDFNDNGETLLELGNHKAVHVTVTQNLKASDTVAFRAAVDYAYNDGYEVTGAFSKNDLSARLSTLINPNDRLSIYLWAQAADKKGFTENLVNKGTDPGTGTYCEMCYFYGNVWNDTRTGPYATPFGATDAERNHYKTDMLGGQIDYQFDGATLSYIPSYLYLDARPIYWLSAIESTNTAHYNQLTQELRLASTGEGPFKWLGGLYYYNSRNSGSEYLFVNQPFSFYQTNVEGDRLKGYAAFGQMSFSVTDTLRIIGGGRASSTDRTAHGFEVVALGGTPYEFDKTYKHFDWKVGVEKDLTPKVMLYGIVQTGFQPGTFNALPNTATFSNEVQPEKLVSYTAGIKSRWFDDRLQINDELYYYNFHNLIIQSYDISAPYNLIFNGDKVAIRGNQLDVLTRVFTDDQANVNIAYSHARNVNVVDTAGNNYNGLQPAYAPDWVIETGYTHNMPIGAATLRAHIDWRWESSWFADYVHNKGTEQTASGKGDATLTYDASSWTAGLWIKNITNKAVIAATAAAGIPGPATAYLEDPRTFGVRFTVKY